MGIVIVACVAISTMGILAGWALYWSFRQRLIMSEAVRDVALQQNRALAIDTAIHPPKLPSRNSNELTGLKRQFQDMINRGAMTEMDEKIFGGKPDES